ncbi:MAG: DUF362 domain-containing protein [Candidatus Hinthialibacter antarcticus]|nr:DUF362 domain-containing protein [Candidatus Hinthialibacter antarcticus]
MQSRQCCSRRTFLKSTAVSMFAAANESVLAAAPTQGALPPTAPVALHRCNTYQFELVKSRLSEMFDWLGTVRDLVKNKTVTIKVNLTGHLAKGLFSLNRVETVYTHPMVTLAACKLFEEYGATRCVVVESIYSTSQEEGFIEDGYDVSLFQSMCPIVEFENTRNKGRGGKYHTLQVGDDGYLFNSFDFNHRYVETDVMVSIAKMKNHDIAGITLSMKNMFGITPNALYGSDAQSRGEGAVQARGDVLHSGQRSPETDGMISPVVSHNPGFRVPRIVTDINRARPIDLAIVDAVVTQSGGEGAWNGDQLGLCVPGVLIAGTNCVNVDAVGSSVMNADPQALGWTKPFYNGENTFQLAADKYLGTNNLSDIDVVGTSIAEARYAFLPGADKE